MAALLIELQRMLNVFCNRTVHIFIRAALCYKRGLGVIMPAAQAHRAAVTHIIVDPRYAQHFFKFAVRDQCGMQHDAAVIEFLRSSEDKAQRIRTRKNDLHARRGENIRKQRGAFYKVIRKCDLIDEHIPVVVFRQPFENTIPSSLLSPTITYLSLDPCLNPGIFLLNAHSFFNETLYAFSLSSQ